MRTAVVFIDSPAGSVLSTLILDTELPSLPLVGEKVMTRTKAGHTVSGVVEMRLFDFSLSPDSQIAGEDFITVSLALGSIRKIA